MLEAFMFGMSLVIHLVGFLLGVVVALVTLVGLTVGIYSLVVGTKQALAERKEMKTRGRR